MRRLLALYKYFIFCAVLLGGLNFLSIHFLNLSEKGYSWEEFDPHLVQKIQSVDQLLEFADNETEFITDKSSLEYAIALDNIVKRRFYHGYSHYSMKENWMAAISYFIWSDLSAIVIPDDILKYPMAACSQQSIVLMECFKRRGIDFRKILFQHHYALQGRFGEKWFYFDPNLEPNLSLDQFHLSDSILRDQKIIDLYQQISDSLEIKKALAKFSLGKINSLATPEASMYHRMTWLMSRTLWLLPLFFIGYLERRRKKTIIRRGPLSKENYSLEVKPVLSEN